MRLPALAVAVAVLMLAGCGAGEPVTAETVTETVTAEAQAVPQVCLDALDTADDLRHAAADQFAIIAEAIDAAADLLDATERRNQAGIDAAIADLDVTIEALADNDIETPASTFARLARECRALR